MGNTRLYKHLTLEDRLVIEKLYNKASIEEIADVIGKTQPTVYRELQRFPSPYRAIQAHNEIKQQKKLQLEKGVETKKRRKRIRLEESIAENEGLIGATLNGFLHFVEEVVKEPETSNQLGQDKENYIISYKANKILKEAVLIENEVRRRQRKIKKLRKGLDEIESKDEENHI